MKSILLLLLFLPFSLQAQFCKIGNYAAISEKEKCRSRQVDEFFFSESLVPLEDYSAALIKKVTTVLRKELKSKRSNSFKRLPLDYQESLRREGMKLIVKITPDWGDTFDEDTFFVDFELDSKRWVLLTVSVKSGRFRWDKLVAASN